MVRATWPLEEAEGPAVTLTFGHHWPGKTSNTLSLHKSVDSHSVRVVTLQASLSAVDLLSTELSYVLVTGAGSGYGLLRRASSSNCGSPVSLLATLHRRVEKNSHRTDFFKNLYLYKS